MISDDPSALDSAMIRPGRVDAIIELTRATRQQAEDLFNVFYKPYDEETPAYDLAKVPIWAKAFARTIRHREFSVASLQNFLLEHRTDPAAAITAMPEWVRGKRFPHLLNSPPPRLPTAQISAQSPEGLYSDTTDGAAELFVETKVGKHDRRQFAEDIKRDDGSDSDSRHIARGDEDHTSYDDTDEEDLEGQD